MIFDICVILFILILPIANIAKYPQEIIQGMFFVFGTIFLMLLSYMTKPRRNYKSIPLALLAILSFIYLFWKNWYIGSMSRQWFNWCIMNEGFLYMFFGIFLIKTIVENAKNYRLYYIALFIVIITWLGYTVFDMAGMGKGWSYTPILALLIGGIITLARVKRTRWWAYMAGITGVLAVSFTWQRFFGTKWLCRMDFWKFTIARIVSSKGLGYGFIQNWNAKDGFVSKDFWDITPILKRWVFGGNVVVGWRNNDFLELGEYLGILAIGLVIWFMIQTLNKAKPSIVYFLCVSSIVLCFFQRTMFHPVKAGIVLVVVSLLILKQFE